MSIDPPLRYDRAARALHWLLAALMLGELAFGWWLTGVPRNTPQRGYFVNLHKSLGLVTIVLVALTLLRRRHRPPPPLPAWLGQWTLRLAALGHGALYALMLAVPLAGYVASNFSRFGVKFFGLLVLPPWGRDDKALYALFNQAHQIGAWLLAALVALHIGAAAQHGLRRDGIFSRIWLRPF